jgi:nitrate/nitrite transporter NarK
MLQFVVLLFAVALTVKLFWYIVGITAAIVVVVKAVRWGRRAADERAERIAVERRRLAGLVARADQQHDWTMHGDPRGTYGGEFPTAPTDHGKSVPPIRSFWTSS